MSNNIAPVRVGIVGCGNISDVYFYAGKRFHNLEIVACADLLLERAQAKAHQHGVPKACTVDKLLSDPDVELVVNLTIPKAHAEVALAALHAGKHVYGEKPLAVSRAQGKEVVETAKQKGLRVGSAPDTFLGGAHQTCRKVVDEGLIGQPVAASAFMLCHGHESWHPDPEFYYAKEGGGPMLDMGPYYLTALINLLGSVRRVAGSTRITLPERIITSQKKYGTKIPVETPTHLAGLLDFSSGAIVTLVTSFDVWAHHMPHIDLYGTEGSLLVSDPNGFGGRVLLKRYDEPDWREIPLAYGYTDNARGLGVADMAAAIRTGRPHRASGDLAFHVLDVMLGVLDSSEQNCHYFPETNVQRPPIMPEGLADGEVEP